MEIFSTIFRSKWCGVGVRIYQFLPSIVDIALVLLPRLTKYFVLSVLFSNMNDAAFLFLLQGITSLVTQQLNVANNGMCGVHPPNGLLSADIRKLSPLYFSLHIVFTQLYHSSCSKNIWFTLKLQWRFLVFKVPDHLGYEPIYTDNDYFVGHTPVPTTACSVK